MTKLTDNLHHTATVGGHFISQPDALGGNEHTTIYVKDEDATELVKALGGAPMGGIEALLGGKRDAALARASRYMAEANAATSDIEREAYINRAALEEARAGAIKIALADIRKYLTK